MAPAKSIGDGAAIAALTLRAEVEAGALIAGSFSDCGCDAVAVDRDAVGSFFDAVGGGFAAEFGHCACVRVKVYVLTTARNRRAGRETING